MYTEFYGLSARPFQLSPNSSFFYAGRAHRRAVAYLAFGLQQGEGFVVITGEVGVGKTTLVAYLEEQLSHQRLFVAHVNAVSMEAQNVLKLVARSLKLAPERASTASLLDLIEHDLRQRHHERQRVLLVVDEAQSLSLPALDALLSILSNLTKSDRALIQILLLGHPQFRDTLAGQDLKQLRQRVVASAHLGPLEADEIQPYLEHRLRRAGWNERPALEPAVFDEIYAFSRGLPRRVNLLAAHLLVHGANERAEVLTAADVRELALELKREQASPMAAGLEPDAPPPPRHTTVGIKRLGWTNRPIVAVAPPPATSASACGPWPAHVGLPLDRFGSALALRQFALAPHECLLTPLLLG
jgi:type II secretory pathway predicted ATPase ExeA